MPVDPNSAFSTLSSVGQKVESIQLAEKISSGVNSIVNATQKSFNDVSVKVKSAFTKDDVARQARDVSSNISDKPAVRRVQSLPSFTSPDFYPAEMKYFTKFTFWTRERKLALSIGEKKISYTIFLPLPSNISETFDINYETPNLGIIGGSLDTLINQYRNTEGPVQKLEDYLTLNNAKKVAMETLKVGADAAAAGVLQKMATSDSLGGFGAALRNQLRVAPNPFQATIFSNVQLRTHGFKYKFAPKSEKELKQLKGIIKKLKRAMLPGDGGFGENISLLLDFPDNCDIEFGPVEGKPYFFKTCVLSGMTVNYTPENTPAFFKTGDPVAVEIDMTFKEVQALKRSDLDEFEKREQNQQTPQSFNVRERGSTPFGGSVTSSSGLGSV